jgi:ABC-type sugar transport system permease subunit
MEETAIVNTELKQNNFEAKKIKKRRKFKRNLFIFLMLAYPILQFLIFWLYVNINTVIMTFQRFSLSEKDFVWNGLNNYSDLFNQLKIDYNTLLPSIKNSLLYFPFNNFILLPISILCSFILSRKIAGYKSFRVIFFLPSIISIVVLTMVYKFMLDSSLGPINKLLEAIGLGKVIPSGGWLGNENTAQSTIFMYCLWAGIGYNVVLLSGAINRVPKEITESAQLDGIGMWKELFYIVIPLIFPTITTLFVIGCTVVFTLFLQPMLLTQGGPNGSTMTIAYYIVVFTKGTQAQMVTAATVGVFFSIIGIPIIFGIKILLEKITPQVEY